MAKKRNVEDIYPLSPVQAGMMFHTLYAPQSGIYFEQLNCVFQGNIAITAFKYAWEQIIQRHDPLRTAFIWEQLNEPVQVVQKRVSLPWQQYDWRSMNAGEQQTQLERLLQSDRAHDFDLTLSSPYAPEAHSIYRRYLPIYLERSPYHSRRLVSIGAP